MARLRITNQDANPIKLKDTGLEVHTFLQPQFGADVTGKITADGGAEVTGNPTGAFNYYSGIGDYAGGYAAGEWRKTADGMVVLNGLVRNYSGGTIGSGGNFVLLPTGSRPPAKITLNAYTNTGTNRVDINTDGSVQHLFSWGNGGWISLSGLTFYAGW